MSVHGRLFAPFALVDWLAVVVSVAGLVALPDKSAGSADDSTPPTSAADSSGPQSGPPSEGVVIEGMVTYTGSLLDPIPVPEAGTVRHLIEVDPKTMGLKDAVVWLEGVKAPAERPDRDKQKPAHIDQRNHFFIPHVLAIEAGQEVEFLNSDSSNHGVMATAFEPDNSFNVVTVPGGSYKHRFRATKRPIPIGCPIHTGMAAWVCVFEHPYFAITDAGGRFRLPPVPAGSYTLVVRHLDGAMHKKRELTLRPGEAARLSIAFGRDDLKAVRATKSN